MKHHKKVLIALVLLLFLTPFAALAQLEGTYEVTVDKKQEEKKSARWTLAEWLAQKHQNQMMDLWLAKNSYSSPFEFFFDTQSINYNESSGTGSPSVNRNLYDGDLAAYAGRIGLRGGYETDTDNRTGWYGSLNFRILGRALQDTHINLEYGLRGMTLVNSGQPNETFQNQYGGVSTDIYLTKFFGLEGKYLRILPAQSDLQRTLQGEEEDAGIFIDFSFFRIFGNWRHEFLHYDGGTQPSSSEIRDGIGGGIRLYF
jgi:hypothetical protein